MLLLHVVRGVFLVVAGDALSLKASRGLPASTPLSRYPAKELCSNCGLCRTSYISHVKSACAFIGNGWSRIRDMEVSVHGRGRKMENEDELYFGVFESLVYAKNTKRVENSAWTGVVTGIAAAALDQGLVDAVIGVGRVGDGAFERMMPRPVVCRSSEEVLAQCPGVKPVVADTLSVLDDLRTTDKRILFLGVGCQVRALRALDNLPAEQVYVLGTNCADNVRSPEALETFLRAVSQSPETAVGFEFMQSYTVDVKHVAGGPIDYERVPVFTLPSGDLKDIIAPSCYSCFDYSNSLADLVVGYMATPDEGVPMTQHSQYVIVRNERGRALLDLISDTLATADASTGGDRTSFAKRVTEQDLDGLLAGTPQLIWNLPMWVARFAAKILTAVGPSGIEFAKSSIDYHQLRNAVYLRTKHPDTADAIIPDHALAIENKFYPGFTQALLEKYSREDADAVENARRRS